jgi:hypothetical protein
MAYQGNLWLVGEKPNCIDCQHIQYQEGGIATLNIWNKVRAACLQPGVSDPFLFSNDDFFFLKQPDWANYPYYYGSLAGNSSYKKIAHYTIRLLSQAGLDTKFYDVHHPMIVHKGLFLDAYDYFQFYTKLGQGLVMKSCYCNYAEVTGEQITDMKLAYWNGEPSLSMFSIGDGCIDNRFKAWCESRWPEKSLFEKL